MLRHNHVRLIELHSSLYDPPKNSLQNLGIFLDPLPKCSVSFPLVWRFGVARVAVGERHECETSPCSRVSLGNLWTVVRRHEQAVSRVPRHLGLIEVMPFHLRCADCFLKPYDVKSSGFWRFLDQGESRS